MNRHRAGQLSFLFQTGAIKRDVIDIDYYVKLLCFYSKLVRLKGSADFQESQHECEFLFQTGAIKS